MKRLTLIMILCATTFFSAVAVPAGVYSNEKWRNKVLITSNQEVHILDSEGKVMLTMTIIKENPDGSFTTQDRHGAIFKANAWWKKDGKIYLNIVQSPRTLTLE